MNSLVLFRLTTAALFPVLLAVILYILDKKTPFGGVDLRLRQVFIGIVFGAAACLATQFGIPYEDSYIMNVRSAAPLTAGLLFGGPSGIIAGVIGGVYRWLSVYWGIGTYTRVACSVATVLAGIIGTVCRKFMFDNKKASWFYGLFISMTTEVLHMLLVFVTHINDISKAFTVVRVTAAPMIIANGISVMLSSLLVSFASREKGRRQKLKKPISQTFSVCLFLSVFVAYFVTSSFTYYLQNNMSEYEVNNLLSMNIGDVKADISDTSDANLLKLTGQIATEITKADFYGVQVGSDKTDRAPARARLSKLLEKYNVTEINIVDPRGRIALSTNPDFDGYDLGAKKDGQAKAFLCLLEGETRVVQDYQALDYDPSVSRKYAGVATENGGFVQVGYDAQHFQKAILDTLAPMARNRHIGEHGFVFILNATDMQVVSAPENTVTAENIAKFVKEIDRKEDNQVISFQGVGEEKFFCMHEYVENYIVVGCIPVDEAVFSRDTSVYIGVFMQIVVFAALFVLVYFLIKRIIVDNIHKINVALAKITGGDLNTVVNVRDNEEFSSLSDDINTTVSKMKEYIAEAEARIDKELEFAKTIQHSALPSVFPPYPNRREFDIYAMMATAKEVGGDFYDFYLLGEDKLAFLMADVSGKGIPAAMFMMTAKTMLKSYAESGLGVAEVFTKSNQKLCESNEAGMFVTAWMGILDLKTGAVRFANAGHNPPLVKHKDGSFEYFKCRAGFVLAAMEGVQYKENELILQPGDEIYLYTDGVTEATDAAEELFGEARLQTVLNEKAYDTARELCDTVKSAVDTFVGEAPQFDDITMLSLKFNQRAEGES